MDKLFGCNYVELFIALVINGWVSPERSPIELQKLLWLLTPTVFQKTYASGYSVPITPKQGPNMEKFKAPGKLIYVISYFF